LYPIGYYGLITVKTNQDSQADGDAPFGTAYGTSLRMRMSNSALSPAFPIRGLSSPLTQREIPAPEAPSRRTKIWEFNTNLHCSIIGTCLTTQQLRQVLRKLGKVSDGSTDHELHGVAVSLASRHDEPARRLHKALDHSYKLAVSQFSRAGTEDEVRAQWRAAVKRGDIPGPYWATLTHEATTQDLIREAFGEVHMLSHLVGAANRADIQRLQALEAERTVLTQKLEDQAQAMLDVIHAKDAQITTLRDALARPRETDVPNETAHLQTHVTEMERRLQAETTRCFHLESKLTQALAEARRHEAAWRDAEQAAHLAIAERDAVEQSLLLAFDHAYAPQAASEAWLDTQLVLYVGGRPSQVPALKAAVERLGGKLLHHDGGVEHHVGLLPGFVSRADIVAFPVDCISHDAANIVKLHCQQRGKGFLPLRSTGLTSLIAGLRNLLPGPGTAAADYDALIQRGSPT
jgi:hypothetical protein